MRFFYQTSCESLFATERSEKKEIFSKGSVDSPEEHRDDVWLSKTYLFKRSNLKDTM